MLTQERNVVKGPKYLFLSKEIGGKKRKCITVNVFCVNFVYSVVFKIVRIRKTKERGRP